MIVLLTVSSPKKVHRDNEEKQSGKQLHISRLLIWIRSIKETKDHTSFSAQNDSMIIGKIFKRIHLFYTSVIIPAI